ncbi:unnamed protein product [Paramecium sonneborni]|uniref:Uncharacterized protein n=1 Tax=Paramecium sonneborni TaxID=65129 RepID=A0A8S1RH99_9CILI|nr:unnamed protein product [Paramecium sonneborni]
MKRPYEVLKEEGIKLLKNIVGDNLDYSCYSISQPHVGSVWITYQDNSLNKKDPKVVSLFYHPNCRHLTTTNGKLGEKKSCAGPGEWAISEQTKGDKDNKSECRTF